MDYGLANAFSRNQLFMFLLVAIPLLPFLSFLLSLLAYSYCEGQSNDWWNQFLCTDYLCIELARVGCAAGIHAHPLCVRFPVGLFRHYLTASSGLGSTLAYRVSIQMLVEFLNICKHRIYFRLHQQRTQQNNTL